MNRLGLVGVAAVAVLLSGSAVVAQTTLRIGLAEDPDVLDPTLARTYVGRIVFASLCDKLFDIDENINIVPQLALSHDTSADGKIVTIKLRPGVKFHDGEMMDAEAVKASLERHMTMQGSFRKPELSAVDKVEIADPLTIRLLLKSPFSPLIAQLADRAGMIVSPKAANEVGDKFGLKPVCAGPFKFVERVQQDRIVLEKFAGYWNAANIHVDRVVFRPITESTVRLANLKSGSLEMIERALATDLPEIRADPRLKLATVPELGYEGVTVNVGKSDAGKTAFGKDPRIIQAFSLSLDREAITRVVFNGEFLPGNQWISPKNPYYQSKFPVPKRDVAKAKELLRAAGVTAPLAIDLMVPNNPETRQVAEIIQAMAGEAGFDIKIRVTEFATSLKEAEEGRYQGYMLGWSGRVDPDGNAYMFHRTNAPLNYGGYSNPDVDRWLDEARSKGTLAERKAAYEKVAEQVLSEGPIVYLYHRLMIIAHTAKLDGYKPMPDGLIRLTGVRLKP
jgi:peptide/nickel transport system substrate-binding protein